MKPVLLSDLARHKYRYHSGGAACHQCGKQFNNKNALHEHKRAHHNKADLDFCKKCEECGEVFYRKVALRQHQVTHQRNRNPLIPCEVCAKMVRTHEMNRHIKHHVPDDPVDCTTCGKNFSNKLKLERHIKHNHTEKYSCEICGHESNSKDNLRMHQLINCQNDGPNKEAKGNYNKSGYCATCEVTVDRAWQHQQEAHTTVECLQCSRCGVAQQNYIHLSLHLKQQHGVQPSHGRVQCAQCDKTFSNVAPLKNHAELVHEKLGNTFHCTTCGKSFGRMSSLRHHELLHSGKPVHSCQFCGTIYKEKRSLTNHLQTSHGVEPDNRRHRGPGPYQCQQCDYYCRTKKDFSAHMRRVHGIKVNIRVGEFNCDLCDFKTKYKENVKLHRIRVHQENRRKSFIYNSSLRSNPSLQSSTVVDKTHNNNDNVENMKILDGLDAEAKAELLEVKLEPDDLEDSENSGDDYDGTVKGALTETEELTCAPDIEGSANEEEEEDFEQNKNLGEIDEVHVKVGVHDSLLCKVCGKAFKRAKFLEAHMRNFHKIVQDNEQALESIRNHKKTKKECRLKEKCPVCGKNVLHLVVHMRNFHSNEKHPCPECGKIFNSKSSADRHILRHSEKEREAGEEEEVICDECSRTFRSRRLLLRHKRIIHCRDRVSCELCGLDYKSKTVLADHKRRAHRPHEVQPCPHCSKLYNSKITLYKHIRDVHTSGRCGHCGLVFKSIRQLDYHKQKEHSSTGWLHRYKKESRQSVPADTSNQQLQVEKAAQAQGIPHRPLQQFTHFSFTQFSTS